MQSKFTFFVAEFVASIFLLTLGMLVIREGVRLGPGWGDTGPDAGFFPFALALVMMAGGVGALVQTVRNPKHDPFFEVPQEVQDLLMVGIPIALYIATIPWLGLYLTTFVYVAGFAWWYGRMPWYKSVSSGLILTGLLFLALARAFRLSMPLSVFYGANFPF